MCINISPKNSFSLKNLNYVYCESLDVKDLFLAFRMDLNVASGLLEVKPPGDPSQCKISDHLEDSCKTLCKVLPER